MGRIDSQLGLSFKILDSRETDVVQERIDKFLQFLPAILKHGRQVSSNRMAVTNYMALPVDRCFRVRFSERAKMWSFKHHQTAALLDAPKAINPDELDEARLVPVCRDLSKNLVDHKIADIAKTHLTVIYVTSQRDSNDGFLSEIQRKSHNIPHNTINLTSVRAVQISSLPDLVR